MVLESNDSEMPGRTPAQKRQETMSRKKLQELAELRELEGRSKVQRKAMTKALQDPAWKKKKRQLSTTATSESNHTSKKKKVTAESSKKGKATTTKLPGRKTTRCEPAVIQDSDEELSDEPDRDCDSDPAPKRKDVTNHQGRKSKAVVISDDEAEDEADEADDDQEEEEESDDSLEFEKLDMKALKDKIWRERAQWAAESEHEDQDNIPKLDLELTTASEADLLPNDENSSGEELRLPSAGCKKPSKRELDRCGEVPQWKQSDNDSKSDIEPSGNEEILKETNKGWHRAPYIPPQHGRLISIMGQPATLQKIIRAAIRRVMGDMIFENTYVSSDKVFEYNQKILSTVAKELKEELYAQRFAKDHSFAVVVGRVLCGRVSTFRGHLKKIALSKVEGFYQLVGPDCKLKVESLIRQTSYIFPRNENGSLIRRTKPFHHLAIVSALRQVLDEGGLADKHNHRFTSSINEEPRLNELEMPAALVAAVATAIHSALDDYSTGTCIKTEFNADVYEDVYRAHVTTLVNIQKTNPDGYHRLMADLYNMSSSGGPLRSGSIANNAMELIEFGEMDI